MGNLLQLRPKINPKLIPKKSDIVEFIETLNILRELYIEGYIEDILILINGDGDKTCAGNGLSVQDAKEMCRDFISNPNEYMD
ncbi:MAG: hypothetical protein Q8911_00125 [Bacillota bacterium]|nr:hypothetical protein [Bacillota bacterium]